MTEDNALPESILKRRALSFILSCIPGRGSRGPPSSVGPSQLLALLVHSAHGREGTLVQFRDASGMGEGALKALLTRAREGGLLIAASRGARLSGKGLASVEVLGMQLVNWPTGPLAPGRHVSACILRGEEERARAGGKGRWLALRDRAVRGGASGMTILLSDEKGLAMAGTETVVFRGDPSCPPGLWSEVARIDASFTVLVAFGNGPCLVALANSCLHLIGGSD